MPSRKKKEELESNVDLEAEFDEGSLGEQRLHFTFPAIGKGNPVANALYSKITGGVYILKGGKVPDTITIKLLRSSSSE